MFRPGLHRGFFYAAELRVVSSHQKRAVAVSVSCGLNGVTYGTYGGTSRHSPNAYFVALPPPCSPAGAFLLVTTYSTKSSACARLIVGDRMALTRCFNKENLEPGKITGGFLLPVFNPHVLGFHPRLPPPSPLAEMLPRVGLVNRRRDSPDVRPAH